MIEREAAIKIYNEVLGAKGTPGKLVRVAAEGFYEVTIISGGKQYTALLPVATTVILAADGEEPVQTLDAIER